jgi:hypothetical protein
MTKKLSDKNSFRTVFKVGVQAFMTKRTTHVLMIDELAFAASLGLERGCDVDDHLPQGSHVCWPYGAYRGALCSTKRLWGHVGTIDNESIITCLDCASVLRDLQKTLPADVIPVIAKLAENVNSLNAIAHTVSDALWLLDHPSEKSSDRPSDHSSDPWKAVREAVTAHDVFHAKSTNERRGS